VVRIRCPGRRYDRVWVRLPVRHALQHRRSAGQDTLLRGSKPRCYNRCRPGGGVGLVALIATGFASPQELDGWASVDTDFVFDFGIKGTAEYLKSLYEVGKAGKIVNSFGKGVAYAEDYKKTKWVVENAIKNQEFDVSKQQFIALPIPTPFPTAVQASIGKRASELAVISWHPVDLREKLRQLGNTMSPT